MPDQQTDATPIDLDAVVKRWSARLAEMDTDAGDDLADDDHALTRWLAGDVFGELDPAVDVADWRREAACVGMPLEVFFPESGRGRQPDYSRALEVCATCPVTAECAAEARYNEVNLGVFGGTTPDQRDQVGEERPVTGRRITTPERPRAVDGRDATTLAPVVVPEGQTYRPCACGCGRHAGDGRMHSSCRSRLTKRRTRARQRRERERQSA